MGRMKESDLGATLARRLDAKIETPPLPVPTTLAEPVAETKKRARDGMRYIGCHIPEDLWERFRTVAFDKRMEKQVLMRKGLEIVLKRYGG